MHVTFMKNIQLNEFNKTERFPNQRFHFLCVNLSGILLDIYFKNQVQKILKVNYTNHAVHEFGFAQN